MKTFHSISDNITKILLRTLNIINLLHTLIKFLWVLLTPKWDESEVLIILE